VSPVDGITIEFNSIEDVNEELIRCYDECINKQVEKIGETLYIEHFFFANTCDLLNGEYQNVIKKYNFCKTFNCPPYPSLDVTPAQTVEDFMKIEQEINKGKHGNK
jgi:hypothetical protein